VGVALDFSAFPMAPWGGTIKAEPLEFEVQKAIKRNVLGTINLVEVSWLKVIHA